MNYPKNIALRSKFYSIAWSFIIILLLNSCVGKDENILSIAVAANAKHAIEEISVEFEKEYGVEVNIISASSGKLCAQIKAGAPYDIFISADLKFPEDLYVNGFTDSAPQVYAFGQLILISKTKIIGENLNYLKDEKIKHISISNPNTAPYGIAAFEALHHFEKENIIKNKLVYGESVGQCNQFFISGAAELALTSQSILFAYDFDNEVFHNYIDPKAYSPIKQGVVLINNGNEDHDSAKQFYLFLFGEKAKEILESYAYKIPV